MAYHDAIKRIKAVTQTRTQAELARVLEIRQPSISEAKKRQVIPPQWLLTLFTKFKVNPDWIKYGTGPTYLGIKDVAGSN